MDIVFLSLCLSAVSPVSCSCLWKQHWGHNGPGLLHLICFAALYWRKRGANPPQLAICTGFFSSEECRRLWGVDMSTLGMGFVSSRAGCCCKQLGGPGLVEDQSPARPSLAATLAGLVAQDRMPWVPVTLPGPNPCPHSVASSLI